MHDNIAKNILNELSKIRQALGTMNANHAEIGKLFKKWNEVEEPVELEMPDRERFQVGMRVMVMDPTHVLHKHTGVIETFASTNVGVSFESTEYLAYLEARQIIVAPDLQIGMHVTLTSPHTIFDVGTVGKITEVDGDMIEMKFESGSGGRFYRGSVKPYLYVPSLLDAGQKLTDDLGRHYPRNWRVLFTMSALPFNWTGADHEDELMTEEAFRIYQAGVVAENKPAIVYCSCTDGMCDGTLCTQGRGEA